jgi:hypothetical protein
MAQVLTCPVPENINFLSPNGFKLSIEKLPELTFFAQEVNLPGLTLGEPEFGTPFSRIPVPGETLTYDTFEIRFMVDEQMKNYKAIYAWMVALGFPESYTQYVNLVNAAELNAINELATNYSDATLQILTNVNTNNQTVQFHDCFPISISSLMFQTQSQDVQYLGASATFKFSYYKFV